MCFFNFIPGYLFVREGNVKGCTNNVHNGQVYYVQPSLFSKKETASSIFVKFSLACILKSSTRSSRSFFRELFDEMYFLPMDLSLFVLK